MHLSYSLPRRYAPSKAPLVGYVSAGNPIDPSPYHHRRHFHIPRPYRRFDMVVLQVQGDSMTLADGTGIQHGTFVLVDTHDILTNRGHVYAFQQGDGTHLIKRLNLHSGRPALHSDNTEYLPILVTSSLRNVGRVYATSIDGVNWTATGYRGH